MTTFEPKFEQGGPLIGVEEKPAFLSVFKKIALVVLVVLLIYFLVVAKNFSGKVSSRQTDTFSISIDEPRINEPVGLPILVTGSALYDWYTDGIFPVQVFDGENNLLATTYALAERTPLEGEHVKFRALFEAFDVEPKTRIGRLVLSRREVKENPGNGEIATIAIDFSGKTNALNKGVILNSNSRTKTTTKKSGSVSYSSLYARSGPDTCADGYDNDQDGRRDAADIDCHHDNNPNNLRSFDGSRDEDPQFSASKSKPVTPTSPTDFYNQTHIDTGGGGVKSCGANNTNCWGLPQP